MKKWRGKIIKPRKEKMMDNYTKMCDCPEIQDGWKKKLGDKTNKGIIVQFLHGPNRSLLIKAKGRFYSKDELIFKPTIEQLMGMVIKGGCWFDLQCSGKNTWAFKLLPLGGDGKYIVQLCRTPEEALIQGVMHELYNKKWSGERWE